MSDWSVEPVVGAEDAVDGGGVSAVPVVAVAEHEVLEVFVGPPSDYYAETAVGIDIIAFGRPSGFLEDGCRRRPYHVVDP